MVKKKKPKTKAGVVLEKIGRFAIVPGHEFTAGLAVSSLCHDLEEMKLSKKVLPKVIKHLRYTKHSTWSNYHAERIQSTIERLLKKK